MNDLWKVLMGIGALSGWTYFGAMVWIDRRKNKIVEAMMAAQERLARSSARVEALQEERHQREAQGLMVMTQINQRLIAELQKRGFTPPEDDADWWKRRNDSGRPPD